MTKWEVYNAIECMGGRATWAQLEEKFGSQSRFSLCLSRLVRDGLLRIERTSCKGRMRYYVIAAPYPERNVWMPDKVSDDDNNNNNSSIIVMMTMNHRRGSATVTAAAS
ncbi:MAG: hypothetical protein AB1351_12250 [Thermoproteota archaeon]